MREEILSMLTQSIKTIRQKLYGDATILHEEPIPYDFDFDNLN